MIAVDAIPERAEKTSTILSFVERKRFVEPNLEKLTSIKTTVQALIRDQQDQKQKLAKKIETDYDGFLDSLHAQRTNLVSQTGFRVTFDLALFSGDVTTVQTLQEQEHPMQSYFTLQQELLS